jgi:ketosteroid isomerase-like protein
LEGTVVKNAAAYLTIFFVLFLIARVTVASEQDAAVVAALDKQYQAAVKSNDYGMMEKILADDFVLVIGTGKVYKKADLIGAARSGTSKYEHQEEIDGSQTVRVWGDTAVVTARLWIKGTFEGQALDAKVWFSDTYVRTKLGWKYVFGQASNPTATL